jgi:hypothetical protein
MQEIVPLAESSSGLVPRPVPCGDGCGPERLTIYGQLAFGRCSILQLSRRAATLLEPTLRLEASSRVSLDRRYITGTSVAPGPGS